MKLVPKPVGHDFNVRRAESCADASKWLPENALYQAYEEISKGITGALIVAWYEKNEEGHIRMRLRHWNERTNDGVALAAEMFRAIVA